MDLQLAGKKALVTGSYRGTGRMIVHALAAEGAHVGVHGFDRAAAETVVREIQAQGGAASALEGDILTDDGAAQLLRETQAALGDVDILVNNYGTADAGSWTKSGTPDWIEAYEKNVLSAVRVTRGLMDGMKAKGWGRIVNLGTIGSTEPAARMPHYYAAKGAMATMTVSLAKDLAGTGVTVNLVSPGLIRTKEVEERFIERGRKKGWGDTWDEVEPHVLKEFMGNLTGHVPCPEEIADVVVFIASARAGAINALNIRVDGGTTALVT